MIPHQGDLHPSLPLPEIFEGGIPSCCLLSKLIIRTLRQYKFFIFNKLFILHSSVMRDDKTVPISQKVKNFVPNQGIYNLLPMAIMKETV